MVTLFPSVHLQSQRAIGGKETSFPSTCPPTPLQLARLFSYGIIQQHWSHSSVDEADFQAWRTRLVSQGFTVPLNMPFKETLQTKACDRAHILQKKKNPWAISTVCKMQPFADHQES